MTLSNATIGQLMIPVEDLDRGVAFYKNVLGLTFLFAAPPQMALFMCGAIRILVGVMPAGQAAPRGSTIYFKVEDIRQTASALEARGVEFSAQPHVVHRSHASELWLAEFTDPDGNHLALMSEVTPAGA